MNNENLSPSKLRSEIGRIYRQIDLYRDVFPELGNDPNELTAIDPTEIFREYKPQMSLIHKLETKVDQFCALQEPESQDYLFGLGLKASVMRLQSSYEPNIEKRVKLIKDTIATIEPFADTAFCFFPYMNMLTTLFQLEGEDVAKTPTVGKTLKKAYNVVMELKRKPELLVWDYSCLFTSTPPTVESSERSKESFKRHLSYCLLIHYQLVDNFESTAKLPEFIMSSIRFLFESINPRTQFLRLFELSDIVDILLLERQLKQLDHCLAGLMFHTVKYRRSLLEHKRHEVSKIQARLSNAFVVWGCTIAVESMRRISGGAITNFDNQSYEEIEEFKEQGVEAYAHQFPIDVVKTPEALMKIIKRCISWYKRAMELFNEAGEGNYSVAALPLYDVFETFNNLFPDHRIEKMHL